MNCLICESTNIKNITKHRLLGYNIKKCDNCNYAYVDTTNLSNEKIYKDQVSKVNAFGQDLKRNKEYINILKNIKKENHIKNVIEIGTPKDVKFLKEIRSIFGDDLNLYSHDIIENKLPNYITFYKDLLEIEHNKIDLLFCIHTLEHIPTNELLSFIEKCKNISKYFIFEVPRCNNLKDTERSSINPHYSFFSEDSILKLFGEDIYVDTLKQRAGIRFSNIKIK